ncbi:MAG: TetR/AcrR family transcriptional regulator [Gammaproteobacteria bacterium]
MPTSRSPSDARRPPRSQAGSLREEHRRVTRERLIWAAEELFQESGYRMTSIDRICKAAGTTPTTFYRYFKSKAELATILQDQLTSEVLAVLRKLEAVRTPSRKAMRAWVGEYFDMWRRVHVLCEAYWEAASIDPGLAAQSIPVSMNMTGQLTRLFDRLPASVRSRAQLRLTFLVLAMDRVAFVVNACGRDPIGKAILDELADILYTSIYQIERAG